LGTVLSVEVHAVPNAGPIKLCNGLVLIKTSWPGICSLPFEVFPRLQVCCLRVRGCLKVSERPCHSSVAFLLGFHYPRSAEGFCVCCFRVTLGLTCIVSCRKLLCGGSMSLTFLRLTHGFGAICLPRIEFGYDASPP